MEKISLFLNPFRKIAGWKSLLIGLLALAVTIPIAYIGRTHFHGLLHFGSASNDALWVFAAEHVVVWLIPALLFWIGGLILSKSKIRPVDVFGTVAFAQSPFLLMALFSLTPPMQNLFNMDMNLPVMEMMNQPGFLLSTWFALISTVFLVWVLVWMFNALRVSCNLKGKTLGVFYCIAVFGGDLLCRLIINMFY